MPSSATPNLPSPGPSSTPDEVRAIRAELTEVRKVVSPLKDTLAQVNSDLIAILRRLRSLEAHATSAPPESKTPYGPFLVVDIATDHINTPSPFEDWEIIDCVPSMEEAWELSHQWDEAMGRPTTTALPVAQWLVLRETQEGEPTPNTGSPSKALTDYVNTLLGHTSPLG